ncbi:hypothetical protein H0H81_003830 [Sphagnurus paluster]|uniref:Transcription factor BYE1 n=1 Tax=Sphagnurus paluster TaxID=117069 RepID=A0A9P7GWY0_9AGAR|nr:hypothetical protein H0H81_003830 [Sphagnurus paluster]
MSTRARTRSAAASMANTALPAPPIVDIKPKSTRKTAKSVQPNLDQPEKENIKRKSQTPTRKVSSNTLSMKKSTRSDLQSHCICKGIDDGSPMVRCEHCKVWYHFTCVDLTEEDAEDIRTWEGPDAFEVNGGAQVPAPKKPAPKRVKRDIAAELPSESEEDPSSEDEYEDTNSKVQRSRKVCSTFDTIHWQFSELSDPQRPVRHLSPASESDSEVSDDPKPRRHRIRKQSGSPAPGPLKRKSHDASHTPPPKRKKPDITLPADDPTRKYCLGKLEELFRDIFLRNAHVRVPTNEGVSVVQKPPEDLTEEEKATLIEDSKRFADDLEKCVFEIYSEPDKLGEPSAGSKYKDRFRMLQFNLSKVDRVVIHQKISSAQITPKEISLMSSTDLANEETKQSIKIAEKEALEYSILTPTVVPRAKITHKGLEDIEDIHGEVTTLQDEERSRREEEEKRERERMARLRAQARQRTASISVPPESPSVVQQQQPWGGPPPVPNHAVGITASTTFGGESGPVVQSFGQPIPDPLEAELNLEDFINMDDDVPPASETAPQTTTSPASIQPVTHDIGSAPTKTSNVSLNSPITGISPFASKSDHPRSASFDLNALWNAAQKESTTPTASPPSEGNGHTNSPPLVPIEDKDNIDVDVEGAEDLDFDMFLEKDSPTTSLEAQQAALDALPYVWTGKINLPLDSTIPQETPVVARQIGGRPLEKGSALWKTLFPSSLLRIDGRVPVEDSAKFLLQVRMNAAKELIAVAFSPTSDGESGFRILSDFLIAKGRHGLVFPWGHRPMEHHPGRELYIIPLLSSDPLPEYMELLDDLHLPKLRKVNLLIGIWVLAKGKLAPPPAPPAPKIPILPPALQNLHVPTPPNGPIPPFAPTLPPAPALPANIAAEVASLTPEQIQLMIQALTAHGPIHFPPQPQPQPPQPPQPPPPQPQSRPPPPPQIHVPPPHVMAAPQAHAYPSPPAAHHTWNNPPHGYGGPYPPQSNSPSQQRYPRPPPLSWDRPGDNPPSPIVYDRDRGDRGGRGWRGNGARGRGNHRPNDAPQKPVDSGWPRRQRYDSGGPGPSW